ncbi:MAG: ATP-binding protein [Candidatus Hydrogenedentota bacterium]|nr:MAG: ATP-binding protein [Candidatus Hydrogenedentota bacterium]
MEEIVSKHKIPAKPLYVRAMRNFIQKILIDHGAEEKIAKEVKAAFTEAANNIIEHAYKKDERHHFIIETHIRENEVELNLIDFGIRVPRSQIKARKADDYYSSGLGVYLIEKLMDFVNYDTSGKVGTRLTLIRKINGLKPL